MLPLWKASTSWVRLRCVKFLSTAFQALHVLTVWIIATARAEARGASLSLAAPWVSRLPPGEKKASAIPCPTWRFVWRTSTRHIRRRLHHDANRRSLGCASLGQPAMDHAYKYTRDWRSCVPLTSPPSPSLRQLRRRHCRAPTRLNRSRLPRCPRRAALPSRYPALLVASLIAIMSAEPLVRPEFPDFSFAVPDARSTRRSPAVAKRSHMSGSWDDIGGTKRMLKASLNSEGALAYTLLVHIA